MQYITWVNYSRNPFINSFRERNSIEWYTEYIQLKLLCVTLCCYKQEIEYLLSSMQMVYFRTQNALIQNAYNGVNITKSNLLIKISWLFCVFPLTVCAGSEIVEIDYLIFFSLIHKKKTCILYNIFNNYYNHVILNLHFNSKCTYQHVKIQLLKKI